MENQKSSGKKHSPPSRLFVFGYGYTSAALAKLLLADGAWSVAGTTRSPDKTATLRDDGVDPVLWEEPFDGSNLDGATHFLVSTPPGEQGCPALNAATAAIAARSRPIQWIGYLSTNGVYGDHDGAWVDEASELRGSSPRAGRRIAAEDAWRTFAKTTSVPLVIFRLPGIYGPGRSAIDSVRAGKAKRIHKPGQVFSRMHVDDIAAAIAASIAKPDASGLFNLADDEPAPPQDVIEYACDLLNVEPPPLTPIDDANLSEMAKSFYADNKRVSNKRMKEALGVTLRYPTYRDGLTAILNKANGAG